MRTWFDFICFFMPDISKEFAHELLVSWTAWPITNDARYISKQLMQAIRAFKNKVDRCEMCGSKFPYHKYKECA